MSNFRDKKECVADKEAICRTLDQHKFMIETMKTYTHEINKKAQVCEDLMPTFASASQLTDLQKIVVKLPTNKEMTIMRERM